MLTAGAVQGWTREKVGVWRKLWQGRAEVERRSHEGRMRLHGERCKRTVKAGRPPRAPFTAVVNVSRNVNVNVNVELEV
jgi:hypothetical protein